MKIGFIARGLTKGGVTRYIENVLKIFDTHFLSENSLILFTDRKDFEITYNNIQVFYIRNGNKIFWDYFKIIPYLFKVDLDVVIYPKNIIPFTHILFKFKKINIIHDLAYFSRGLNMYKFFDAFYMRLFMKLSCNIANKVIAVSMATKKDVEKILKISSSKVIVVYEGVDDKYKPEKNILFIEQILLKYKIQSPFMFYCGSLSPRKNLLRTLKAFDEIKEDIPHNIYLAGEQSLRNKKIREYIENRLSNRVFLLGYVSENDLICLYSKASVYLYPSLYEGFGLPILEAQACGCPVLTSNKTSCYEIAGAGALFVDPYNIGAIKDGILRVIIDKKYREEIIKKGFLNVKQYSWFQTVENLIKCLQSL